MRHSHRLACLIPLAALVAIGALATGCSDDTSTSNDGAGGEGGAPPSFADADGDTISDADEGDGDADGDGTPNTEDTDSDGDGIDDAIEAGDDDLSTEPEDADNDGVPNFLDDDSDGNGILDQDEGLDDFDGDGELNFADNDDDGDNINDSTEIAGGGADCNHDGTTDEEGTSAAPIDCDADGENDYQDFDSDGDTIGDSDESTGDNDGDGIRDRYDDDSDDDSISDAEEAGDTDINTSPVDTDDDGTPDYLDADSDNDGITDIDEVGLGTDPTNVDSDGDGVSDLIEEVAGTSPTDPADNPQANGDFVFVIPYQDPTSPMQDTVKFRTNIQFADVYFAFDTTGSMSAELTAMKNMTTGVPAIVDQLTCDVIGGACLLDVDCGAGAVCFQDQCIQDPNAGQGCIPNLWTGVGRWDDLNTYRNLVSLQPDPAVTAAAIPGTGGGGNEAPFQPAHCIANPSLCPNAGNMQCAAGGIGCPAFRNEAIRIYAQITDADQQCAPNECSNFTAVSAGDALEAADIKFISLYGTDDSGGTGSPASVAQSIGEESGTVDANGDPFTYLAIDSSVVQNAVSAVLALAKGNALNTTIAASDDTSDAVDATQFIDYLEVNISGMNKCDIVSPVADTDADTHDDAFPELFPGKKVCWDVHPVPENTTVPATDEPQIYKAVLTVSGDGSPLDQRDVYFLIPPANTVITPPM
ncbi:MAG: hypothetical protein HOW73_01760 [Polyangiaceae bacterium]|nr:hypothetical protein [Polyangiaceae bacterium]